MRRYNARIERHGRAAWQDALCANSRFTREKGWSVGQPTTGWHSATSARGRGIIRAQMAEHDGRVVTQTMRHRRVRNAQRFPHQILSGGRSHRRCIQSHESSYVTQKSPPPAAAGASVKGSWCVGLARSRLPIRFIGVVTHIPPPTMDLGWVMMQGRPHRARVPAQPGRALGRSPVRNPRSTARKRMHSGMCQKHPRATPPSRRADLPLRPGRATGARPLRARWHHRRALRVPFWAFGTGVPCGTCPGVRQAFTRSPRVFFRSHNYGNTTGRSQTCSTPRPCTAVFLSADGSSRGHPLPRTPGPPSRW